MKKFAIASAIALAGVLGLSSPAVAGPAPALTSVYFRSLSSPTGGFETVAQGQYSATKQHRGATLTVIVREIGTGSQRRLSLNGQNWGSNNISSVKGICAQGGGSYGTCSAGQTVAGYDIQFDIYASGPGTLTYQSTSATSPLATRSVSINLP